MWPFSPYAFVLVIFAWLAIVALWFGFWVVAQGQLAAKPFGVLAVFVAETIAVGAIYLWQDPSRQRTLIRSSRFGLCRECCKRVDDMGEPMGRTTRLTGSLEAVRGGAS